MVVKVTDRELIANLIHMEIDFDNPKVQEIYESFKKLSAEEQLAVFKKDSAESSALRDLALVMYPTEEKIIIDFC
jgi:hypothetical protein